MSLFYLTPNQNIIQGAGYSAILYTYRSCIYNFLYPISDTTFLLKNGSLFSLANENKIHFFPNTDFENETELES